ncbi:hypothetical protein TRFO_32414 [Tritrichomonas foetus]|uniref:Uncharacterized protein n=1 Tax=Tritrichomonas foetus TaxID=1144522 RepID=A0A1J4JNX5_9EUKA|nr:hypothetical protein TRFO_32414 [Tritrichomonas foetus]|eukprot:OHT00847.1 hypothetical protein TRFO_32414 [Tritrichomonas foetus]
MLSIQVIPFDPLLHQDFVTLMSSDLTVTRLIKMYRTVTSLFTPHANELLACMLSTLDSKNKLVSAATKILNSENYLIKNELLKTPNFQLAIQAMNSDMNISPIFVSKFAIFVENYLKDDPNLIHTKFFFFSLFVKHISKNTSVYSMFIELLVNKAEYLPIFEYLHEKKFTEFLIEHLSEENLDILVKCAQIPTFLTPKFINQIMLLEHNRKWEIISKTISYSESPSDFLPLLDESIFFIDSYTENNFSVAHVSALLFISEMINSCSDTLSEIDFESFNQILIRVLQNFPNHSIAINTVFLIIEELITSTQSRQMAIDTFIPFLSDYLLETSPKSSNKIMKSFTAQLFQRLLSTEETDAGLESDLSQNDGYLAATEYIIEIYNPLIESCYGYTPQAFAVTNDEPGFDHFTESPPLMI